MFCSKKLLINLEKCYKNNNLERIIIDESHCITEWGTTFRPIYLKLGNLKMLFPSVQIVPTVYSNSNYRNGNRTSETFKITKP